MSILRMFARNTLGVGGSVLVFAAVVTARADDELPKRLNFDRYKGMLDHSPFAVASAVAPAVAPNACKDLYIANVARTPEGDVVTIMSTAEREFKKYLNSKEGPVDGYSIGNIEWSEKVGETKVTISKDGQFCTLTFNQAVISQPLPNKPGPGMPPPQPPQQPGMQKPPINPSVATPVPHTRGTIQRNPQPQPSMPTPPTGAGPED